MPPMSIRMKMHPMPKRLISLIGMVVRPAPDMAEICGAWLLSRGHAMRTRGAPS